MLCAYLGGSLYTIESAIDARHRSHVLARIKLMGNKLVIFCIHVIMAL